MDYYALKYLHMSCAALSGGLFLLRGCWMLFQPARLQQRWVRVAPHIIDTALLASAVTLAVLSGQYPLAQGWLSAKVLALLLYIVLGTVALKRGKTRAVRAGAFAAALACFGYIVAVAVSKQALPF
ncbi:SirB2 family protein [Rugamonas sp. DEMB1]|uniref:SirB2 family protein n=1 Tax=Rugamonas sp. DEMB1 TaxID=3039386 RepID=UPI00244B602F|nr:SirB2 family protein [Rugamonas sp. DEMB1]WGG52790.1 SirB2 family protein [Rugamonas sp. DEMB1]